MNTVIARNIAPIPARLLVAFILSMPSTVAWSQSGLVEERITNENGFLKACGTGDGLSPCRDANGETYAEEIKGPDIDSESTDELAAEAKRIRNENPAQLEQTISELEQGVNPDARATEGLPH